MHKVEIFSNVERKPTVLPNLDNIFVYYHDADRVIYGNYTDIILFKDQNLEIPFAFSEYYSIFRQLSFDDNPSDIPSNHPYYYYVKLWSMDDSCIYLLCKELKKAGFLSEKRLCKLLHKECFAFGIHG